MDRRLRMSTLIALALVSLLASPAAADSDGCFCSTSSYLAYEVGFSGSGSHELRVIALELPLGESSQRSTELPDFQTHGMLCGEAEVLLLGWEHLYTASVLPAEEPLTLRSERLAYNGFRPPPFDADDPPQNLGSNAPAQRVQLGPSGLRLFLVTEVTVSEQDCSARVVSSIRHLGRDGEVRSELLLYDESRGVECGE